MVRLKTPQLIERRCKLTKTTDFRPQQMVCTLFEVSLRQYACFFLFSGLLGFPIRIFAQGGLFGPMGEPCWHRLDPNIDHMKDPSLFILFRRPVLVD
jgi:hypothetical protein